MKTTICLFWVGENSVRREVNQLFLCSWHCLVAAVGAVTTVATAAAVGATAAAVGTATVETAADV